MKKDGISNSQKPLYSLQIATLRLKNSLSQAEVADAVGVSKNYISAVERGVKLPSAALFKQLADLFSVDVEVLKGTSEAAPNNDFEQEHTQELLAGASEEWWEKPSLLNDVSYNKIDFPLLVWMACRYLNMTPERIADELKISVDTLYKIILSPDMKCDLAPHNPLFISYLCSLVDEFPDIWKFANNLDYTTQSFLRHAGYGWIDNKCMPVVVRHIEKTGGADGFLQYNTHVSPNSRFPGVMGETVLRNTKDNSNWYIYWCDKANAYMRRNGNSARKNWYTNLMKEVLDRHSDLPPNDKVLFLATSRSAYMDLLGAARDCEDIIANTHAQCSLGFVDIAKEELVSVPLLKK